MGSTSDGTNRLAISGPLTLATVTGLHGLVREALDGGGPVVLDLTGSGPCDAAGLQLLLAAVRTGQASVPPRVRLVAVPGAVRSVAEQAGVLPLLGLEAAGAGSA